jgi:hypothetical protein
VLAARTAAEALADKLAGGHWTHDYGLTANEARALALPVKVGMPQEVMTLMKLYPQPVQQSDIEYLPTTSLGSADPVGLSRSRTECLKDPKSAAESSLGKIPSRREPAKGADSRETW